VVGMLRDREAQFLQARQIEETYDELHSRQRI
jgi:hypothetical protein